MCHSNYHHCASAARQKAMQIYSRVNNLNGLNRQVAEVHSPTPAFFPFSPSEAFIIWCASASIRIRLLHLPTSSSLALCRARGVSGHSWPSFADIAPLVRLVLVVVVVVACVCMVASVYYLLQSIYDTMILVDYLLTHQLHHSSSPTAIQLQSHFSVTRTRNRPSHDG